jgi:hypothetical protein
VVKKQTTEVEIFFCGLKAFTLFDFRRYVKISCQKMLRYQELGTAIKFPELLTPDLAIHVLNAKNIISIHPNTLL